MSVTSGGRLVGQVYFAHTELTGFSPFECGFEAKPNQTQSVSNPDETVEVEWLKINTLPGLLCCHLLGPGFAFFCGRKGIREIAYKAGLAHRVFVELHCQKNKRTNKTNKSQTRTLRYRPGWWSLCLSPAHPSLPSLPMAHCFSPHRL